MTRALFDTLWIWTIASVLCVGGFVAICYLTRKFWTDPWDKE